MVMMAVGPSTATRPACTAAARRTASRLPRIIIIVVVAPHNVGSATKGLCAHGGGSEECEKKAELGDHRAIGAVIEELEAGRASLASLFRDRFLAVLVPPWNRLSPNVALSRDQIGLPGLSTFNRVGSADPVQVNTHIDLIAWRTTRGFVGWQSLLQDLEDEITDRLRRIDVDDLTPREALALLAELHEKVHEKNCLPAPCRRAPRPGVHR